MTVIDDFLKNSDSSPQQLAELERIRQIVKQMAPNAEDTISYGIPVVKLNGKYLIGFAPYKDHLSLFPGAEPIETLKYKLSKYKLSKGTIQFTLENNIPDELVKQIVSVCLKRVS
jgi:uncharacterized protein YdhG (YjbR/CyaY superfamily)